MKDFKILTLIYIFYKIQEICFKISGASPSNPILFINNSIILCFEINKIKFVLINFNTFSFKLVLQITFHIPLY